ncbi:MAG: hypothetical protein A2V77_04040 [Anaeromyxobacter sp. RBG_16_69_14]|nr:MAG: hypothetical protein A2V77_04040 [Anaeromyxobacter sp. RBG_16_69_14]
MCACPSAKVRWRLSLHGAASGSQLGRCGTPLSLGQAIGEASGVVDEILRYSPRTKRRGDGS